MLDDIRQGISARESAKSSRPARVLRLLRAKPRMHARRVPDAPPLAIALLAQVIRDEDPILGIAAAAAGAARPQKILCMMVVHGTAVPS